MIWSSPIHCSRVFPIPGVVSVAYKLTKVHVVVGHAKVVVEQVKDFLNDGEKLLWLVIRVWWDVRIFSSGMLAKPFVNCWLARPIAFLSPFTHA